MFRSTFWGVGEGAQKQSCCFPFPPELIEPWYGNYLREYYGTLIEMMGCPIDYGWVAPVLRYLLPQSAAGPAPGRRKTRDTQAL
jgi:hypothetical protein